MIKHLKLKISGKVQGIGFRWCAYEKFTELNLEGKADNGLDGSVIIDVKGEDFNLENFVEWAKVGPQGARVSNVEVNEVNDASPALEADKKPSE
jgi:acylphosphatase